MAVYERGRAGWRSALPLIALIYLASPSQVSAGSISGTFAEDLPRMRKQAASDLALTGVGHESGRATRALQLVQIVERTPNGYTFSVDTQDAYLGAFIQWHGNKGGTYVGFASPADESVFEEYYQKARQVAKVWKHLFKGELEAATSAVMVLSVKFPKYGPTYTSSAVLKMAKGDYAAAHAQFRKAKSFGAIDALHGEALAYLAEGRTKEAQAIVKEVVTVDPGLKAFSNAHALVYFHRATPEAWNAYRTELKDRMNPQLVDSAFGGF